MSNLQYILQKIDTILEKSRRWNDAELERKLLAIDARIALAKMEISKDGRPDKDFFENCTKKASSWADNPEAFCNALWLEGKAGTQTKKSVDDDTEDDIEKGWPSRAGSKWEPSQWSNEKSGFGDSAFRTPKEENWRVKAKKKKGK